MVSKLQSFVHNFSGIIILINFFLAVALTGETFIAEKRDGLLDRLDNHNNYRVVHFLSLVNFGVSEPKAAVVHAKKHAYAKA